MKEDKKQWVPCILMPDLYMNNCNERFFGFDERKDRNGNTVCGFFVDIETYDEKNVITILCKLPIRSIRWTDESGRISDGHYVRENQPDLPAALVYRVENSDFAEWFLEQSSGIYDGFYHYEIISTEDVIDVLCEEEPVLFEE